MPQQRYDQGDDPTNLLSEHQYNKSIHSESNCWGNFMFSYNEACDILDEMAYTSSTWQSKANVPQGTPTVIHLHQEFHDHGQAIA